METAPGALPRPGRVPEQRLLSPKICLRWRQCCETILGKTLIDLGFGLREALNRRRDGVRGPPGGSHHPWAWPGGGGAPPHGEAALWPPSVSLLVHILRLGKIEVLVFGLSNSENISCVAFLKHKTAKNRELALWHLVSRLVLEIAKKCHKV
jgi:hypothetical protein